MPGQRRRLGLYRAGRGGRRGATIGPQCHVGANARIGEDTRLVPRRSLSASGCRIGARGIVHPGAVIGADGFGFAPTPAAGRRSSSSARCASATTSRSAPTPASTAARSTTPCSNDGVKLDNLVHIGAQLPHRRPHGDGGLRRHGRQHAHRRALHLCRPAA
jgi:UDP-3-O-[3-hydroxymyristoyl] glucosamine N-acyltransferase